MNADPVRPNPVLGGVLLRDFGPFIPVWLFGVVLATALDFASVGGSRLPIRGYVEFIGLYSALVLVLVLVGFLRHYPHCADRIEVDSEVVRGYGPRRAPDGQPQRVEMAFSDVFAVHEGGLFGPRVEARRPGGGWDWIFLSPENARIVWQAWQSHPSTRARGGA